MECPDCSWYQLWLGIGIGALVTLLVSLFTLWLIKNPLKSRIEKRFERNDLNVHIGVMGYLNSFDGIFKFFCDTFESFFGDIRDLPKGEWIPDTHEKPTINETGGFDLKLKPEAEFTKIISIKQKLDSLNEQIFKNYLQQMAAESKRIVEYMHKNESYLDPVLRRCIGEYLTWSDFYIVHLRSGRNYSDELFKRGKLAQQIIGILEKDRKIRTQPHIDEYIKKWKDYEKSELNQ